MADDLIVLDANLDRTNIVEFDQFAEIAITTLTSIADNIRPLCGADALQNLVIYRNLASEYLSNVFSNDGIHILKNIEYMSPIQLYIANYIRYIAERVEKAAGDGTSTAIFLASRLIVAALTDVKDLRKTEWTYEYTGVRSLINIMRGTNNQAKEIVQVLTELRESLKRFKIDLNDIDRELRRKLIYQLAYTTSKGNELLTNYAVDLFIDLPELLYEYTSYRRSSIETDTDLEIEQTEHDLIVSVTPSANTQYNSKLNTELLHEHCDLLVVPKAYGHIDSLVDFVNNRELNRTDATLPLIILYTGADPSEVAILERHANKEHVTICQHATYGSPTFVGNPLELHVVQVVSGQQVSIQLTEQDYTDTVIKNIKCRLYDRCLYIYNLFDSSKTYPLHPSYISEDNPSYNKLRGELEEQIRTLKASHKKTNVTQELNEFVRIYKSLICSKMPVLTIGGSTLTHQANINVVDDVLGVVAVAMKHGVILDTMPKLHGVIRSTFICRNWINSFAAAIMEFCDLTYQTPDSYMTLLFPIEDLSRQMFSQGRWVEFNESNDNVGVVQSFKAFDETFARLIETIPRLICTDRIIVPNSVMGKKGE